MKITMFEYNPEGAVISLCYIVKLRESLPRLGLRCKYVYCSRDKRSGFYFKHEKDFGSDIYWFIVHQTHEKTARDILGKEFCRSNDQKVLETEVIRNKTTTPRQITKED